MRARAFRSLFESFEKPFCMWESFIMVRKFLCVVLTEFYPIE